MMDAKARAIASIAQAKSELDDALEDLDLLEPYDPSLVGLVAHAISNYNSVTTAIAELLQATLRDHPDPDVAVWLDGLRHAAELAEHSVGRLVTGSVPRAFPLKSEYVNLPVMMRRVCDYYRRRADLVRIAISCETVGEVPPARGDRVAVAVIADNLLSYALRQSEPNGTVRVRISSEPGIVVCTVCDTGAAAAPGPVAAPRRVLHWPGCDPPVDDGGTDARMVVAVEFVRRMDGELWHGGSCVSFRLPAVE